MDPSQWRQDKSAQDLRTMALHMTGQWSSLQGPLMDLFEPKEEITTSMISKDLPSPWMAIDLHQPTPRCHGLLIPERISRTTSGTDLRTVANRTVVRARRATHALTRTAIRASRDPSTSGHICAFTLLNVLTSAIPVRWHSRVFMTVTDMPSFTLELSPLSVPSATTSLFDQMLCVVIWAVEVERVADKRSRRLQQLMVKRQEGVPLTRHRLRQTQPQLRLPLILQQRRRRRRLLLLEQRPLQQLR